MELSKPRATNQSFLYSWPARLREVPWVAAYFLINLLWAAHRGLTFDDFGVSAVVVVLMSAIALVYGVTNRSRGLSDMAYFTALWMAFSVGSGISTYLAAHFGAPLVDTELERIDSMLGFSWIDWYRFTTAHKDFDQFLKIVYFSLVAQMAFCIIYLSHGGRTARLRELLYTSMITIIVTAILSAMFPALGAFAHLGIDKERAIHLAHFVQLHAGGPMKFSIGTMQGIVTFPSYHTVIAILVPYAFRGYGWKFYAILALNLAMLLSTPSYGGHYLTDILVGAAVAGFAIAVARLLQRRAARAEAAAA